MDQQFKTYETEIRPNAENRQMHFLISTDAVDRDNDTLDPKGWQLDHYRKNPVVAFAHDYKSLPVAKCLDIKTTTKGLEATAEFPPKGVYAFADTVFDMLKAGFLNATSVGFRPVDFEPAHDRKGFNFKTQELTEFSIVPIPSNPEALVQVRGQQVPEETKVWCKTLAAWAARMSGDTKAKVQVKTLLPAFTKFDHQAFTDLEKDFEIEAESGDLPVARVAKLLALHGFTEEASILTTKDSSNRSAHLKAAHMSAMDAYANAHHAEAVTRGMSEDEKEGLDAKALSGSHRGRVKEANGAIGRAKGHALAAAEMILMGHGEAVPKDDRTPLQKMLAAQTEVTIIRTPFEVQTLVMSKAQWSKEAAVKWITDHNYKTACDETGSCYRFRQADPSAFAKLRTIEFASSDTATIEAVGGPAKADGDDPIILTLVDEKEDDKFTITDEVMREVMTSLGPELATIIASQTTSQLNKRLGRID